MTDGNRISEDDLFSALGITSGTSSHDENKNTHKANSAFMPGDGALKLDSAGLSTTPVASATSAASYASAASPSFIAPSSSPTNNRVRNSKEREEQLREKSIRSRQWREELERRQAKINMSADSEADSPHEDERGYDGQDTPSNTTDTTISLNNADMARQVPLQQRTQSNTRRAAYNSRVNASQNARSNLNTPNTTSTHSSSERKPFNNPWLSNQQTRSLANQQNGSVGNSYKTNQSNQGTRHASDIYSARTQTLSHAASSHAQGRTAQLSMQDQRTIPLDEKKAVHISHGFMSWDEVTADSHGERNPTLQQPVDTLKEGNEVAEAQDLSKSEHTKASQAEKSRKLAQSSSKKSQLSDSKKESPLGVVLIVLAVLCILIAVSLLTGLWDISTL